jgi:hypothetical protein
MITGNNATLIKRLYDTGYDSIDKFFVDYGDINWWTWNPNGCNEEGILNCNRISFDLAREALDAFFNSAKPDIAGKSDAFWLIILTDMYQVNYDNIDKDESFITAMNEFIDGIADVEYPVTAHEFGEFKDEYELFSFGRLIQFFKDVLDLEKEVG